MSVGSIPVQVCNWSEMGGTSGPVQVSNFPAVQPVSATALPLPAGAAQDGTDATGVTPPTGASGIRGWLSSCYQQLASILAKLNGTVAVTGTFWPSTQPVSGSVSVSNLPATQPVSGTVAVSNLPATQPVSGSVNVANFPAIQPVSLATNTPDVTDRATRETGRVRLWDGTDEATIIPRDSASTSTDKGLAVVKLSQHAPGYQTVTTEITSATTTGVKENLTLWHPAASLHNVYIVEIGANLRVVQTVGSFAWEVQYINAENATPGGTTLTGQPLNRGDAASDLIVRQVPTGAPTTTGQVFQRASFPLPAAATPYTGGPEGFIVFRAEDRDNFTDAIQLRSGQAEGLRITQNILAAITTAPVFTLYVKYVERA